MPTLQSFLISLIRPLFIEWNDGMAPNPWIENLWATSSPAELYKILGNFQRLTGKV